MLFKKYRLIAEFFFVWLCLVGTITLIITSCGEYKEGFDIGEDFLEAKTRIDIYSDLDMELSTVNLDSFVTSGSGNMLIGNHVDTFSGNAFCESYFLPKLPVNYTVYEDDLYDSAKILLKPNGYRFGDTILPLNFRVYQLSVPFSLNNDQLFNTSRFLNNEKVLSSFNGTFKSSDSLLLDFDDELAFQIFSKLIAEDDDLANQENFTSFINGFVIKPDTLQISPLVGFLVDDDNLYIRIFYHHDGEPGESIHLDVPLYSQDYQFNNITNDFSGTALSRAKSQGSSLLSHHSNNASVVQAGVGLMAKLKFVNLAEMLLIEKYEILRAELYLYPQKGSYNNYALPETVQLYETNKNNVFGNPVYDDEGNIQNAFFYHDEIFRNESYYAFDITNFILNELDDSFVDQEHALMVTLPFSQYSYTLDRLIIDAGELKPALKIYVMTY